MRAAAVWELFAQKLREILVLLDLRDFWGTLMLIWHYVFQCFGLIGLEMYALAKVLATFS